MKIDYDKWAKVVRPALRHYSKTLAETERSITLSLNMDPDGPYQEAIAPIKDRLIAIDELVDEGDTYWAENNV